jgi:hypothetical protein
MKLQCQAANEKMAIRDLSRGLNNSRPRLTDEGYVINTEPLSEDEDSIASLRDRPRIFRRPTIAEIRVPNNSLQGAASPDLGASNETRQDHHYDADSEDDKLPSPSFIGKQVRFQSVESGEESVSDSTPSQRLSRSQESQRTFYGSEEDTVAGATLSSAGKSGTESANFSRTTPVTLNDPGSGGEREAMRASWRTRRQAHRVQSHDPKSSSLVEIEGYEDRHAPQLASAGAESSLKNVLDDASVIPLTSLTLAEDTSMASVASKHNVENPEKPTINRYTQDSKAISQGATVEQDLKQVIRDQITAVLKQNEAQLQERLDQMMKAKLARLGLSEYQIQAITNPERLPLGPIGTPPLQTRQPSYPMIHKQHLEIETLRYYDIPFEYAMDSEYLIILQEMSQEETQILFEHTRRLRSKHWNDRWFIEPDSRNRSGQKDYAFVRKRSDVGPRSRKSGLERASPPRSNNNSDDDRPLLYENSPTKRDHPVHLQPRMRETKNVAFSDRSHSHSVARKERERVTSPEPTSKRFDPSLRVPPFLAWPTTFEKRSTQVPSELMSSSRMGDESDEDTRIKLTLLAIEDRICRRRFALQTSAFPSELIIHKSGNTTVKISTRASPEKSLQDVEVDLTTGPVLRGHDLGDLRVELEYFQLRDKDIDSHTVDALDERCDTRKISKDTPVHSGRRVISWQRAKLLVERDALVSKFRELISQFVPEYFNHSLIQRCWGSVETISKVGSNCPIVRRPSEGSLTLGDSERRLRTGRTTA